MVQIEPSERLIRAALTSDTEFVSTLNRIIKQDLRISVRELSKRCGVAQSTLYKILQGERSPGLSTLRAIIHALGGFQHPGEREFICVIAARYVLEGIEEGYVHVDGKPVLVREYPVHTVEDVFVAAVRAEREGAVAIVCAPIVSSTVEQLVRIPVTTMMPRNSIQRAIEVAARKAWH